MNKLGRAINLEDYLRSISNGTFQSFVEDHELTVWDMASVLEDLEEENTKITEKAESWEEQVDSLHEEIDKIQENMEELNETIIYLEELLGL